MPTYAYRAKDTKGEVINGTMEAEAEHVVASRLQTMGYFPLLIRHETKTREAVGGLLRSLRRGRVRAADLATFNRQMADLLSAGITLVKALTIITSQTTNETLRDLVTQISADVQGGDTLAQAMSKHPQCFSKLYTAMVHAGETGGMLESILSRLADFSETEQELRGKVKAILIYPMIMVAVGTTAVTILMTVVMPRLVRIYSDLNQTLPTITQVLITISTFIGSYWWAILLAIAGLILAGWKFVRTEEGKTLVDTWLLRLPALGSLIQRREIARFARTFGALLRNGVPILPA
ncbi:type II secretion system F family protein, partial [Candidatus Sumerlaeota bacterium]|nr:type II secretion system F family protein [Candidatus Sumerlaeota bacterium]